MITLGRSVLLYGSQEQIAQRLASLRDSEANNLGTVGADLAADGGHENSLDFDLGWSGASGSQAILHRLSPPELPERLGPCQAAQLSELLEYLHIRIRSLLDTVQVDEKQQRVTLDERQWQSLLDLQSRLATYLRDRPAARRRVTAARRCLRRVFGLLERDSLAARRRHAVPEVAGSPERYGLLLELLRAFPVFLNGLFLRSRT